MWADQQGEQPVIQYDKEKLGFFTAGYGKDGIVDKILGLDIAKVTHVEEIRDVERHTNALRILGKFIDSHTCIVCDTEGIDPDVLYKRKSEAKAKIIRSLDKTTKNIVEGILKTIDDADPFGIRPALYALIENGDAGLFEGVCEEFGAYYESMCNEFINELKAQYDCEVEYGTEEKDNLTDRGFLWVYRRYLNLISDDTVGFTGNDEKFIRMAVADLMRKDISLKVVEGDNGRRLALYLDGGALLGQERNTLPLSTGEQNFISLAFELLRAKRSKKSIIVLDDPISSFDSIYKNKVAYLIVSMLRNDNKKKQRCILLTHNIDLLRVLDAQIEGCFSLYIMGNGAHSENGFFPVSVAEKDMLLYASSVMKALRDELLPEDILDEEMYLISIVPFVRGVARIHGYDKSFERLSQIMHGTLTKSVNISAAYKWIITRRIKKETGKSACNGYVPHGRTMLTSDKVIKRIREWRISGCPDILNPGKYGLLNKALKHIASFMYLRMYAEKVLCSKFGIDGSDMLFGNICSKAMEKARTMYPSRSEEIMEWKAGLMSKKALVNDFNHFEGSLSIFFPAIDVSDEVLQRESDSIEAILTAIENAS